MCVYCGGRVLGRLVEKEGRGKCFFKEVVERVWGQMVARGGGYRDMVV